MTVKHTSFVTPTWNRQSITVTKIHISGHCTTDASVITIVLQILCLMCTTTKILVMAFRLTRPYKTSILRTVPLTFCATGRNDPTTMNGFEFRLWKANHVTVELTSSLALAMDV